MLTSSDWRSLGGGLAGEVLRPGSAGYDRARIPAFALPDPPRPAAVVRCRAVEDVVETLAFARRAGIGAVPRSGGHCFAGRSSTSGVVVDVGPLQSVRVDGDRVAVGAGARLGELYPALAGHGLALPAGCGPTVGIAGLTLGGGLGILGRRHGLTSDRLVAATVVLADGRVVECGDARDGDLFWALRGAGGGQFGVVTELTFRPVPAPDATAFHLVWPHRDAARVVQAWQRWAPDAPDELAASLLITAGADPARPPVVNVFGAMTDTRSTTTGQLSQLVAAVGTDPSESAAATRSYRDTKHHLAELGDRMAGHTGHAVSRSEFVARDLPAATVHALLAELTAARVPGQARELDFTPWAGAYGRVPVHATAFAHRTARYLVKHTATAAPGVADGTGWLDRSWALVRPCGTGGVYPNFPDPRLTDGPRAYHGGNLDRLRRVKAAYDPDGFFRFPQSL